jgi:hypothetical protein
MWSRISGTLIALALLTASAQATTYFFNDNEGGDIPGFADPVAALGSITTDGALGVLTSSNILTWSVSIGGGVAPLSFDSSSQYSSIQLIGYGLIAKSEGLFWNYDEAPGGSSLVFTFDDNVVGDLAGGIAYEGPYIVMDSYPVCRNCGYLFGAETRSGLLEIASVTPIPATFPLFVAVIGVLGLLARRRRGSRAGFVVAPPRTSTTIAPEPRRRR